MYIHMYRYDGYVYAYVCLYTYIILNLCSTSEKDIENGLETSMLRSHFQGPQKPVNVGSTQIWMVTTLHKSVEIT